MKLYDIPYDKTLDNYGQNYKSYADINAGQIVYYIDKSIEDPFYKPNYVISSKTTAYLDKDPMDAIQTYYVREPLKNDNPIGPTRNNYEGCLSWIEDTMKHREDIMALQSDIYTRTNWAMRYAK
jgi:hypothetical protein